MSSPAIKTPEYRVESVGGKTIHGWVVVDRDGNILQGCGRFFISDKKEQADQIALGLNVLALLPEIKKDLKEIRDARGKICECAFMSGRAGEILTQIEKLESE